MRTRTYAGYFAMLMATFIFVVSCASPEKGTREFNDRVNSEKSQIRQLIEDDECSLEDKIRLISIDAQLNQMQGELNSMLNDFNKSPSDAKDKAIGDKIIEHDTSSRKLFDEVNEIRKRCGKEERPQGVVEALAGQDIDVIRERGLGRFGQDGQRTESGEASRVNDAFQRTPSPVDEDGDGIIDEVEPRLPGLTPPSEDRDGDGLPDIGEPDRIRDVFSTRAPGAGGGGAGGAIFTEDPLTDLPDPTDEGPGGFEERTFVPADPSSRQAPTFHPTHRTQFHRLDVGEDTIAEDLPLPGGLPGTEFEDESGLQDEPFDPLDFINEESQSDPLSSGVCYEEDERGCKKSVEVANPDQDLMITNRSEIYRKFFSPPGAGAPPGDDPVDPPPPPPGGKVDCGTVMSGFSDVGFVAGAAGVFSSASSCTMIASSSCTNCVTIVVSSGGTTSLSVFPQGASVMFSAISVTLPPPGTPFTTTVPATVFGVSGMLTITVTDGSSITASVVFMPN